MKILRQMKRAQERKREKAKKALIKQMQLSDQYS